MVNDKINCLVHLHPDFDSDLGEVLRSWNSIQDSISFIGIRPRREYELKLLTGGTISSQESFVVAAKIRTESGYCADDLMILFTEKDLYSDLFSHLILDNTFENDSIPNVATISLDYIRYLINDAPIMFRAIIINIIDVLAEREGLCPHDAIRGCILDFCENMEDIMQSIKSGPKFCKKDEDKIHKLKKSYLLKLVEDIHKYENIELRDAVISNRISSPKARLMESNSEFEYDVALSFAGEDRKYAKELAENLKKNNVKVFYDEYEKHLLWGRDLYTYFYDLYRLRAKYCVIFISKNYKTKLWTNHEREAAQARAFSQHGEYILPIKLNGTEVPGISPTRGYLNWMDEGAEKISLYLIKKLKSSTDSTKR